METIYTFQINATGNFDIMQNGVQLLEANTQVMSIPDIEYLVNILNGLHVPLVTFNETD